mmetsp:Transcript_42667/g.139055  ORF Transcript_42667/g.139055 Transcript_42667/m.139055 type:complete len:317 (-) Transcript_42667:115-1065(-)
MVATQPGRAPRAADLALNLREGGGGIGIQKVRGAAAGIGRRVALAVPKRGLTPAHLVRLEHRSEKNRRSAFPAAIPHVAPRCAQGAVAAVAALAAAVDAVALDATILTSLASSNLCRRRTDKVRHQRRCVVPPRRVDPRRLLGGLWQGMHRLLLFRLIPIRTVATAVRLSRGIRCACTASASGRRVAPRRHWRDQPARRRVTAAPLTLAPIASPRFRQLRRLGGLSGGHPAAGEKRAAEREGLGDGLLRARRGGCRGVRDRQPDCRRSRHADGPAHEYTSRGKPGVDPVARLAQERRRSAALESFSRMSHEAHLGT